MKTKKLENKVNTGYLKILIAGFLLIMGVIPFIVKTLPLKKEVKQKKIEYKGKEFKHIEEGIVKDEKVEGVKFSNIVFYTKDGQTTFTADVTNISNKDIKTEDFDIDLLDKKDKAVITLRANIPNGLKKGETKKVTASAKGEFKNVVSKAIKKIKATNAT